VLALDWQPLALALEPVPAMALVRLLLDFVRLTFPRRATTGFVRSLEAWAGDHLDKGEDRVHSMTPAAARLGMPWQLACVWGQGEEAPSALPPSSEVLG
jgi:hypothetical protein